MKQKFVRLAVIVAAFLVINQFRLVTHAAQDFNCECLGEIETYAFLTPPGTDPVCATHPFDYVNNTFDGLSCQGWCLSQINQAGVAYCATDRIPCIPKAETNYFYSGRVYFEGFTYADISNVHDQPMTGNCPCC